jgi:S1-C subfamily serine protease
LGDYGPWPAVAPRRPIFSALAMRSTICATRTRLRMRRAPGNLRPKRVRPPGAVVLQVESAAERAGLKPGDLVTELDGTPVRDAADLQLRPALLRICREARGQECCA